MTEEQIIAVMRSYRVQRQYRASTEAGTSRYAVWHGHGPDSRQISEPMSHSAAERERERLVAREIMEGFSR